ncbi:MAG: hypothetical protein LH606_16115 [Cytophagaceae bacterium]|nr:hypothetical protein [Cytophagaceae bacterium]
MKTPINAQFVITRQQYDEAAAKLPSVSTYPNDSIAIEVDASGLLAAVSVQEPVVGDGKLTMKVTFIKYVLNGERLGWARQTVLVWKLCPFYKVLTPGS